MRIAPRLIAYLAAWLRRSKGRLWLPVHRAIARAYQAFRLALPSERTIERIVSALRGSGLFSFSGGRGRGHELMMALPGSVGASFNFVTKKNPTVCPAITSLRDTRDSNSGFAGVTGDAARRETGGRAALERTGFALAKEFQRTWWDNCKVTPPPIPVLAADITAKLRGGASATDILAALERLLSRHHMLAVDHGLTRQVWSWSGLLADFRRIEFPGSPAAWYRRDRANRSAISQQISQSFGQLKPNP